MALRLGQEVSREEAAYKQELHSASSTIASLLPTRKGARLHAYATTDYYFALRKVSPPS